MNHAKGLDTLSNMNFNNSMIQSELEKKADERFDVVGVQFSVLNLSSAAQKIEKMVVDGKKGYVCVCPVSTILECARNPHMMEIVNNADVVTTDGMPSVWIGKSRGYKNLDRVYGPDLMLALCEISQAKGYRNYFYGATDEVLNKLQMKLKNRFPNVNISGSYAPSFRPLTEEEDRAVIEKINSARPDFLWVGLGSPKQDYWIHEHRAKLNVPVMLAVGAAFDFLSGQKPQAPRWMQRSGLEWLFRLCSEPKRLWRRYLIGNTVFLYLLIKQSFKRMV